MNCRDWNSVEKRQKWYDKTTYHFLYRNNTTMRVKILQNDIAKMLCWWIHRFVFFTHQNCTWWSCTHNAWLKSMKKKKKIRSKREEEKTFHRLCHICLRRDFRAPAVFGVKYIECGTDSMTKMIKELHKFDRCDECTICWGKKRCTHNRSPWCIRARHCECCGWEYRVGKSLWPKWMFIVNYFRSCLDSFAHVIVHTWSKI